MFVMLVLGGPASLLRNAELSASLTTLAPIESLASRRLRLLPKSQQIMAMLQKTDQKCKCGDGADTKCARGPNFGSIEPYFTQQLLDLPR